MSKSRAEWIQVELKETNGAEPWVIVRYRGGSFKLPAHAPLSDVLLGVRQGWQMNVRRHVAAPTTVRVRLDEWRALHAAQDRLALGAWKGRNRSS